MKAVRITKVHKCVHVTSCRAGAKVEKVDASQAASDLSTSVESASSLPLLRSDVNDIKTQLVLRALDVAEELKDLRSPAKCACSTASIPLAMLMKPQV